MKNVIEWIVNKVVEYVNVIRFMSLSILVMGMTIFIVMFTMWYNEYGWTQCGVSCYPLPDFKYLFTVMFIATLIYVLSHVIIINVKKV